MPTALPAATITATNRAGASSLIDFDPTTPAKTMPVGTNVMGAQAGSIVPPYSNLCKNAEVGGSGLLTTDASLNPATFSTATFDLQIIGFWQDGGGLGRGLPIYPNGDFVVMWDGPSGNLALIGSSNTTATEKTGLAVTGQATDNKRVFTLTETINSGPTVILRWVNTSTGPGAYANSATNIRVFPPGIDPANPPLFHPQFLAKLAGFRSLRFMDAVNTIGGYQVDYADYSQPGLFSYVMPARVISVGITDVRAYTGGDTSFDRTTSAVIQVTTSAPHTLSDGQNASLAGAGTVTFSDTAGDGNSRPLAQIGGLVKVLSSTVFIVNVVRGTSDSPTMTNVITSGTVNAQVGGAGGNGAMPFLDCIRLCNEIGSDIWVNVANTVTTACAQSIGALVGANLSPGLVARFEYCNEPWNTIISRGYLCMLTSQLVPGSYNDPYPGYVHRAGQVYTAFLAGMTAQGRGSDSRLVLGGQRAAGNTWDSILQWAAPGQYNVPFDHICLDGYVDILPGFNNDGGQTATFDLLSVGQCVDLADATIELDGPDGAMTSAKGVLQAAIDAGNAKPGASIVIYEGGPDTLLPQGSTADYTYRSYAVQRHPRMYWVELRRLQKLQEAHVAVFHRYAMNIGLGRPGQNFMWDDWNGLYAQPGTGSLTADSANVSDPLNLAVVKSEPGGAGLAWAALVAPPGPDTTPPVVASAGVNAAGSTLTVLFTESGSPPVLPASGVAGFTLTASGGAVTLSSTAISGTTFTATTSRTILSGETLTLAYSPGNVTDSASPTPNAMGSSSGLTVANNSTQTGGGGGGSPTSGPRHGRRWRLLASV